MLACCSTVAKQEFKSICIIEGAARLIGRSIRHLLQNPTQTFRVKTDSEIQVAVGDVENMKEAPALADFMVVGEALDEIIAQSPAHFIRDEAGFLVIIRGNDADNLVHMFKHDYSSSEEQSNESRSSRRCSNSKYILVNDCLLCQELFTALAATLSSFVPAMRSYPAIDRRPQW